jgi:hypothetical protein
MTLLGGSTLLRPVGLAGQPNGLATLDTTGGVPLPQLGNVPAGTITSVNGNTGPAVVLAASDVGAAPLICTVHTVTAAGTSQTIPAITSAQMSDLKLTSATCALAMPAATAGAQFLLVLRQDSTGGRLVTWTGIVGTAPALATAPNAVDVFLASCTDGSNWLIADFTGGTQGATPVLAKPTTMNIGSIGSVTLALAASAVKYCRVTSGSGPISNIGALFSVSSGNVAVAVYRDNGSDAPGALVAQSGSTACPAVGVGLVPLGSTVTVNPGDWIAYVQDNATAAIRSGAGQSMPTWLCRFGTVTGLTFVSNPSTSGTSTLPALWGE